MLTDWQVNSEMESATKRIGRIAEIELALVMAYPAQSSELIEKYKTLSPEELQAAWIKRICERLIGETEWKTTQNQTT